MRTVEEWQSHWEQARCPLDGWSAECKRLIQAIQSDARRSGLLEAATIVRRGKGGNDSPDERTANRHIEICAKAIEEAAESKEGGK